MNPITFTNGSKIFTSQSSPPQLGDVNNDGTIDILDAGDVNAFQLTDLNGDGVIDVLDASEYLSNPPPSVTVPPTVPPPDDSNIWPDSDNIPPTLSTYIDPQVCEETPSEPRFTFSNGTSSPGIITTGCNSIYNVDGEIIWPEWPPVDPFFCPEGQARGWKFVPETGEVRYTSDCTCAESDSTVHAASIFLALFGPAKTNGKKVAKEVIGRTIATAEDSLKNATKYRKFLDGILEATLKAISQYQKAQRDTVERIGAMQEAMITGINRINGKKCSESILKRLPAAIELEHKSLAQLERYLIRDEQTIARVKNEMAKFDALIAKFQGAVDKGKSLLGDLDHFDPETWITIMMGALIPIGQFLVPKECASNQFLDEECNCVNRPIVSGSYSYSNLNKPIDEAYITVQNLEVL